jgi:murein DD-endopeptidase MepM/ murein hydrolase activator NlpD
MRIACLAIGLLWAASSAAEVLYRLPWPEGLSFMFTQVSDGRITSHFTKATLHAVDIAMPEGIPVLAARAGVVEATEMHHGASPEEDPFSYEGNFVRVRHADGSVAIYAHLKHHGVAVALAEAVAPGQLLGYSGASGDVLAAHLHFVVVHVQADSSGARADVSVPVRFYVGQPPVAFAPRAALRVTANYSGVAEAPRTAREALPLSPWKRQALEPGEEARAWCVAALWLACGIAGLAWFWRFSKG